jgi:hypothetical protein
VILELVLGLIVISSDGCLQCSVHPLDPTVGPGRVGLGEKMLDAMLAAGPVERVAAPHGGWTRSVLGQVGELNAVVRAHGVDFVGDRLDQA